MKSAKLWMKRWLAVAFVTGLTVTVSYGATEWVEVDGVNWSYSVDDGGATVMSANPAEGNLTIPSFLAGYLVTGIGRYAFNGCSGLTSVTFPDSVTEIGEGAFSSCSGLTSLTIPDSVTRIVWRAFFGCSSLTNVMIPDSVTSIGTAVFSGCSSLASVTVLGNATNDWIYYYDHSYYCPFYNCVNLSTVVLGEKMTRIGNCMFSSCTGLTSVTILGNITNDWNAATRPFSNCTHIATVELGEKMTKIGSFLFYGCNELKNVAIPDGVTLIGAHAFSECSGLADLTIPDGVTAIGDNAFSGCNALTNVTFGNSVMDIGPYAFSNCYNIKSLTIPDSVQSIGICAFEDCKGLVSCSIGKGVESIGEGPDAHGAFANAFTLPAFSVDPENPHFKSENGALYTKDGKELVAFPAGCRGEFAVPNGVEKIWAGAFCGAFDLKLVIIPDSVTEIGGGIFSGCSSLADVYIPARFKGNEYVYSKPYNCTFHYERPVDRTLTLDGQGGIVETVTIHPSYCEPMPKITVPTREGYRFGGYFSEPNGGGVQYYNAKGESCRTWDSLTVTTLYALWLDMDAVATPVIVPGDGAIFDGESCEVTITCATEGASIYYSTNGAAPRLTEAYRYAGPFAITDSTVVKAVAELDGVKSDYATASIRRMILTLADAAGAPDLAFATGGAADWVPVGDLTSASGLAVQCGAIGLESETWLETTVSGAGSFEFAWKVDCERDDSGGATWDHLAVRLDGTEMARIDGTTGWATVTLAVEGAGTHTVCWTFAKDDFDEAECRDLAWVSGVQWSPSGGGVDVLPEARDEATVASILAGAADGRLKERTGSVAEYGAFRAWVSAKGLDPQAVLASPHAWISYALGADRLFENEPTIQIGGVAIALEVRVVVNDGEMEVLVDADKIAGLFEATGNPGDWNGTATLPAIAKPTGADGAEMRFKVLPGDGTSGAAFLRIAP